MEESLITWNATNFVTVCLMALAGFVVLGFVSQVVHKRNAANAS